MQTLSKNIIILVDAYSTGKYLAPIFNGNGYHCIHVIPSTNLSATYMSRYEEQLFLKTLIYQNDLPELLQQLAPYQVKCVIPGSEAGVCLADAIAHGLQLNNVNELSLSSARRNKFEMQEALKNYGLRSIPQILTDKLATAIDWANQINYPIVLKPLASSDAEGVRFCDNEVELVAAFNEVKNSVSQYGEKNTHLLIQKKLIGQEYVVNSVSHLGKTLVTDIWTNQKKLLKNSSVYDHQRLLSPEDTEFHTLADFTVQVLQALKITFGAAHAEMISTDDGIYLIEVGARLSGGFNPSLTMEALQYSQVSSLVDIYLRPDIFHHLVQRSLAPKKHALIVSMISNAAGNIVNDSAIIKFKNLSSFYSMQSDLHVNSELIITNSLSSSPGNIYLIADNKSNLLTDYQNIRLLEQTFYKSLLN